MNKEEYLKNVYQELIDKIYSEYKKNEGYVVIDLDIGSAYTDLYLEALEKLKAENIISDYQSASKTKTQSLQLSAEDLKYSPEDFIDFDEPPLEWDFIEITINRDAVKLNKLRKKVSKIRKVKLDEILQYYANGKLGFKNQIIRLSNNERDFIEILADLKGASCEINDFTRIPGTKIFQRTNDKEKTLDDLILSIKRKFKIKKAEYFPIKKINKKYKADFLP